MKHDYNNPAMRFNPLSNSEEAALESALSRAAEQPTGRLRRTAPKRSEAKPPTVERPQLTENSGKNSYELRFPGKPADEHRQRLLDEGWRFLPNKYQDPLWYRRRSPQAREFAVKFMQDIGGQILLPPVVEAPVFAIPAPGAAPVQRAGHLGAIAFLRQFIGTSQLRTMVDACRGEEGEWFKAKLVEMAERIKAMPHSYQTDGQGDAAVVHLHYFTGGADWFITEKDVDADREGQHQAFGLADLFRDGGELGYISLVEILGCGAELDLHWTPKPLSEVRAKRHVETMTCAR